MASSHQSDGAHCPRTPATAQPMAPTVDYKQEVRFAVVMYGGVSLAIYINGVAQEMLRWVRSTARSADAGMALLTNNCTRGK